MTEGLLEVLLVKAKGIQHKHHHLGPAAYYIVAECGRIVRKSKVTKGKGHKVQWNEKLSYEFPVYEWKHSTHLKLKIMNSRLFGESVCVGETTIYLGGIVGEGIESDLIQEVRPSSYNVVLDDETYRGEIVVGLKFTMNNDRVVRHHSEDQTKPSSLWKSKVSTWKICGWKLLFSDSKRIITRDNKRFSCNPLVQS